MLKESFTKISFYIVAHADDWQLFMCPNIHKDLIEMGNKVVIIITTAGDAGRDETYWKAREEGTKSSLSFCLSAFGNFPTSEGIRLFNQHDINYFTIGKITVYFFRLPDGNLDGEGFKSVQFQSLSKLRTGRINSITSLDDSTTYLSWEDFYMTLEGVICEEKEGISESCINYINPDENINVNEHADHLATGNAIQDINRTTHIKQLLYQGYSVADNYKDKLQPTDLFWKVGMFAAYDKAVRDNSGYSTLQEGLTTYLNWCLSTSNTTVLK